jgi:hypothetical protein
VGLQGECVVSAVHLRLREYIIMSSTRNLDALRPTTDHLRFRFSSDLNIVPSTSTEVEMSDLLIHVGKSRLCHLVTQDSSSARPYTTRSKLKPPYKPPNLPTQKSLVPIQTRPHRQSPSIPNRDPKPRSPLLRHLEAARLSRPSPRPGPSVISDIRARDRR